MRFTKREVALAVALLSSGVFAAPTPNFEARAVTTQVIKAGLNAAQSGAGGVGDDSSQPPPIPNNGPSSYDPNTLNPDEIAAAEQSAKSNKRDDGASHEYISISRKRDIDNSRAGGRGFEKRLINPVKTEHELTAAVGGAKTLDKDAHKAKQVENGAKKGEEATNAVSGGGSQNHNGAASTPSEGTTKPADTSAADKEKADAKANKKAAKAESKKKSKELTDKQIEQLKDIDQVRAADLGPNQLRQLLLDPKVSPELKAKVRKDPKLNKKLSKAEDKHGAAILPNVALTKDQIEKLNTLPKIKEQEALLTPAQLLQLTQSKDRAELKKQVEKDPVLGPKLAESPGHHAKQQSPAQIKTEAQADGISVKAEEDKQNKADDEPPTTPKSGESATPQSDKPGLFEQGLNAVEKTNTALSKGQEIVDTSTGLKDSVEAFRGKGAKDATDASTGGGGNDTGTDSDSETDPVTPDVSNTKDTVDAVADVADDVTSTLPKGKTPAKKESKRAVTFTS